MPGGSRIPRGAAEAIYERIIETQSQLAELAREQGAAGVQRDRIMDRLATTIDRLSTVVADIERRIVENDPAIAAAAEAARALPRIAAAAQSDRDDAEQRILAAIVTVGKTLAHKQGRLVWWLGLSTLVGSALGSGIKEAVDLLRAMPH